MNVSESIDWKNVEHPWDLDRHRFIAITHSGQTLDGYLFYLASEYAGGYWELQDVDGFAVIIRRNIDSHRPELNRIQFESVNVLKETQQCARESTRNCVT
ncbi:hypothetical protein KIH79_09185 [Bifidobacterium sp. 82T10]|uniref:Uncharacterized protein n=1 Tax=Bifidobacterium miconis TaxID=2834435 RepID=A0ABS6WG94_9BIFI|nr:hypothetical protein [Bifidobacterium miconis]MBW3093090.1 hypothetical protein [Bifidobacterium miconis]